LNAEHAEHAEAIESRFLCELGELCVDRRDGSSGGLYFRVPRVDLLVVGEAFEDLIFAGLPRLPKRGEELRCAHYVSTVGGGAVITAAAAARLGVATGVISALSAAGVRYLRTQRVHITNVKRADEPHAVTAALSTPDERSLVTFDGVNVKLEPRLLRAMRRQRPRHVHFALAPVRIDRWIRLVDRLRAGGITTSWDFGWNPSIRARTGLDRLIAGLDVVFMNAAEASLYARARRRARTAVIKLGARGSRWLSRTVDVTVSAPRVRVVDTTGAGDAFNGGFLAGFLEGRPPRDCLRRGNVVGAASTTKAGGLAGLPSLRAARSHLRAARSGGQAGGQRRRS
jgi:sugar/nucleoside kinase (ribokinase family)